MPRVTLDFESANTELEGIVIGNQRGLGVVGSAVYSEHWATQILCLRWRVEGREGVRLWTPSGSDVDASELGSLARHRDFIFDAHGTGFEKDLWRNIMVPVYGFPDIPNDRWDCTQARCAVRQVPQGLDKALVALDLGEKDKVGSKLTISLSKVVAKGKRRGQLLVERTPEVMQRVYSYCGDDVEQEDKLRRRLGPMPADERAAWLLSEQINERGVRIDLSFVQAAQQIVRLHCVPLVNEFHNITGLNPGQRDKILSWVRAQGPELADLKKTTIDQLLGDEDEGDESDDGAGLPRECPDDLPDHVRRALAIRRTVSSAAVQKYDRMAVCVGSDGRSRRLLNYHGAGPGRWAGRLWQPHNLPRPTVLITARDAAGAPVLNKDGSVKKVPPSPEAALAAVMSGDPAVLSDAMEGACPIECVKSFMKLAIIPAEGHRFAGGDFAGVEMRIDLALAGQRDKCEMLATGADVYLDMADDIYGKPKGFHNKDEHNEPRQIGKNTVLGCGFRMGWQTFTARYLTHVPADEQEAFAKRIIKAYRETWAPMVPLLWAGLEEAALEAVNDPGVCTEAYGVEYQMVDRWLCATWQGDGSKIWYLDATPCRQAMPWSTEERPDVRDTWKCRMQKNGRSVWTHMHGGVLTENMVQHLARQQLVHSMKLAEREGYPVVLTVHDSLLCEPRAGKSDDTMKNEIRDIMRDRMPSLAAIGFPCEAECWAGGRWYK